MKADREAKDRKVGRGVVWIPQPAPQCVVPSLLYCTLFKGKQRCRGSFFSSTAREIAVLPAGKLGRRIFPPLPKRLLCKTCRLE